MSGGDFLARWSRRKLEARQDGPRDEAPAAPPEDSARAEKAAGGEPEITPEELAALPKPDELTPESDLTAFFRKGVPDVLRNAALRRMWSLDPAIRDFESPARDYAWDWNQPGGVPGNGPLLASDDVESMLRRVFGDGPEERAGTGDEKRAPSPEGGQTSHGSEQTKQAESGSQDAAPSPALQHPDDVERGPDFGRPEGDDGDAPAPVSAAPQNGKTAASRGAAMPRRHGRARPV